MIYTEYDYMPQTVGDAMTALWDQHWDGRQGWNPDYTREPLWRTISDIATREPGRLLEAGCGVGKWISYFNRMGHQAIGVDYAPSGLRVAAAADPTLVTVRCDCRALPFESNSFDYVFAAGTVEHDPAGPEAALREFVRVLRPGGWLMSSVPCLNVERHLMLPWMLARDFLKRRAFVRRLWGKKDPYVFYEYVYSPGSYRRVLENCGFEVVHLRPYGELNDLPLLPKLRPMLRNSYRFYSAHMVMGIARKPEAKVTP